MQHTWDHPEFMTTTCLEWKPLIEPEAHKDIIIDSLRYMTAKGWVLIMGFVLMSNHFHLIWQIVGDHRRMNVQRDFMKYIGQRILRSFKENEPLVAEGLRVNSSDRKYQVWERNSLGISLTKERFLIQKLNYIHNNPVKAGLCKYPEEYKYSSARFYICNEKDWDFLVHYRG